MPDVSEWLQLRRVLCKRRCQCRSVHNSSLKLMDLVVTYPGCPSSCTLSHRFNISSQFSLVKFSSVVLSERQSILINPKILKESIDNRTH